MRVIPREDLDRDLDKYLLIPYRKLVLGERMYEEEETRDGYIPSEAYPLKVIHSDDNGYLILLLDEHDDNSTIVAQSIDFDFIADD